MDAMQVIAALALVAGCVAGSAQQATQVQLKIEPTNRTLTVSAEERVTADPDLAILHIGFQTPPSDAKAAYAAGAKTSNDVVAALKQAGIPETSIRSESQQLKSIDYKAHKFELVQEWTVKTPPERAADILEIAIAAGATQSGDIDWTMKDVRALEDQALSQASARAKADAAVLARGMDAHLGALVYVTNQVSSVAGFQPGNRNFAALGQLNASIEVREREDKTPLAIEPHKVSRTASVYAVYAIE
jgi:uncharacterized protein YggE